MYHKFPIQVHLNLNCLDVYYEDVNVVWSMTYPYGQECTRYRCLFQSSIGWHIGSGRIRLRLYLFCEGRISVLKRRFKTPIQNAVHGGTVYAYLEKKPISWACTAHAFTTLTEGGMSNGARAFSAFWIQAIVCSCTCLQRGTSSSSESERRLYDVI